MRATLENWISDADAIRHLNLFDVKDIPLSLAYQEARKDDLYLALVGELFDSMRDDSAQPMDWARIGNALAQYAARDREKEMHTIGVTPSEAALYAAAAFYFGGFPASAYLTMKDFGATSASQSAQACFDLLARPPEPTSRLLQDVISALRHGDLETIASIKATATEDALASLHIGPEEWISARLLEKLLARFSATNLRAVLPDGAADFWTLLVSSFLNRGVWDFFPSQIEAIQSGLLQQPETFSLQMPTGAGKTALCETLLYWHLNRNPGDVAVLLVPYRSLASELRNTLVVQLNLMGISARCAYGGSVPSGDEIHALEDIRALVATPETLSGILSANPTFFQRISLVICDEGHLLDAPSRGVGLELLLARMKVRVEGVQRFIFISAIVPNVEEINLWLGGTSDTVVRSDYRPAIAEFAVLRPSEPGPSRPLDLEMHPHENPPIRFKIGAFLRPSYFKWMNTDTGRTKTYPFSSVKTRAIAAARKALPMGAAVVFAANKRGNQGAIGLAKELLKQLNQMLNLPEPIAFSNPDTINITADYLEREYGADWVGTLSLRAGAVLHHGDIPQETREVIEAVLRKRHIQFGICTSTLAEGVNLPIRTLVLYSVKRGRKKGKPINLPMRDIKNLVGRAGRAGATTKGLVICANEQEWSLVEPIARQAVVEPVIGALKSLIQNVRKQLALRNLTLTNELLEQSPEIHSLIDGIDSTLVDLAATEIGEEEFIRQATQLADQTFAAQQTEGESKQLLRNVFVLRAKRVEMIRSAGRLDWVRETGTRARMLDSVEIGLLPMRPRWDDVTDPIDTVVVKIIMEWAWTQPDLKAAVRDTYRVEENIDIESFRQSFFDSIGLWLSGSNFVELAVGAGLQIDDMLGLHSRVIAFTLQTIVEQAVALLERLLQAQGQTLAPAIVQLPEHLRFGVPTAAGRLLASGGVRHRRAFVLLGDTEELRGFSGDDRLLIFNGAQGLLMQNQDVWQNRLGVLVMENTLRDLSAVTARNS